MGFNWYLTCVCLLAYRSTSSRMSIVSCCPSTTCLVLKSWANSTTSPSEFTCWKVILVHALPAPSVCVCMCVCACLHMFLCVYACICFCVCSHHSPMDGVGDDGFVPDPLARYRLLLSAALRLCLAILTSLGIENKEAAAQVSVWAFLLLSCS